MRACVRASRSERTPCRQLALLQLNCKFSCAVDAIRAAMKLRPLLAILGGSGGWGRRGWRSVAVLGTRTDPPLRRTSGRGSALSMGVGEGVGRGEGGGHSLRIPRGNGETRTGSGPPSTRHTAQYTVPRAVLAKRVQAWGATLGGGRHCRARSWACTQAHVCPRTRMVAGPATHPLATAEAAVTENAPLRGQQGGCAVGEEGGSATHPHDVARCSPAAAAPQPLLSTNTVTAGDVQHIVVGGCG